MCGIYGITEKNKKWVKSYIDKCDYRGPDMNQIYMDDYITLGHNLLSNRCPFFRVNLGRRQKEICWCIMEKYLITKSFVRNLKISSLKQNVILRSLLAWGLDEFNKFINQMILSTHLLFGCQRKK